VSPFAADSARKNTPKAEAPVSTANAVNIGSAALAVADLSPEPEPQADGFAEPEIKIDSRVEIGKPEITRAEAATIAEAPKEQIARTKVSVQPEAFPGAQSLRDAVLNALSNQQMLVSLLETAEWSLNGNTLLAKVTASSTMIEMSFTADARRVAGAAASGVAGRPIKMLVEPGGVSQTPAPRRHASNGNARSRAEQDPIVQRMQEKFKAEIRTVIDYREKG
jgi:hypothetical protein